MIASCTALCVSHDICRLGVMEPLAQGTIRLMKHRPYNLSVVTEDAGIAVAASVMKSFGDHRIRAMGRTVRHPFKGNRLCPVDLIGDVPDVARGSGIAVLEAWIDKLPDRG